MNKTCNKCQQSLPLDSFGNRKDLPDGKNTICKKCRRSWQREWKKSDPGKDSRRRYQNRRRRRIKLWLFAQLGVKKCKTCPESHVACLDFHHRDRGEKQYNIGDIGKYRTKEVLLEEAKKCDVLCANCHRKLHWGEVDL